MKLILTDVLDELYKIPLTANLYEKNLDGHLYEAGQYCPLLVPAPFCSGFLRSWPHLKSRKRSSFESNECNFEINVDVQQFTPEEISVKIVGNYIIVDAKHVEQEDRQGLISRQFTRRYKAPEHFNFDHLTSTLSSDGVLTLCVPKNECHYIEERSIPIIQTNGPVSKVKEESNGVTRTSHKSVLSSMYNL